MRKFSQKQIRQLVAHFGVGAKLFVTYAYDYVLYEDFANRKSLRVDLSWWRRRHVPGIFTLTITSMTEVVEMELVGASSVFKREYEACEDSLKRMKQPWF